MLNVNSKIRAEERNQMLLRQFSVLLRALRFRQRELSWFLLSVPFRIVSIIGDRNTIKTGLNIKGKVFSQKIAQFRVVLDSGIIVQVLKEYCGDLSSFFL